MLMGHCGFCRCYVTDTYRVTLSSPKDKWFLWLCEGCWKRLRKYCSEQSGMVESHGV